VNPAADVLAQNGIARAISREALASLPLSRYEGSVRLVTTAQDLAEAQADLEGESAVGFDTETRPAFRKGESHLPSLAQVATARAVYLFPLRYEHTHTAIARLLGAAHVVKAGVALANDMGSLRQVFTFTERNVLDLGHVARRCGLAQTGVRNLAGLVLGVRVPKGARTSNWAAPRLSESQVAYAATDAWICRELLLRFRKLGLLGGHARTAAEGGNPNNLTTTNDRGGME